MGIKTLDRQIKKFSTLQVYTNQLFQNIQKSSHLNNKGKEFLKKQLMGFQKNNLDSQRVKIESIIKNYHSLDDSQKKKLSKYFRSSIVKNTLKKRADSLYDKKLEHFLMRVNLNKVSSKKLDAISNYTKYSNTHSKEFNLELAKLKNLYLFKDVSTKKITALTFYLKDPKLSKIIATTRESLSFSKKNYSVVNSRLKRIQKKSVQRRIASAR